MRKYSILKWACLFLGLAMFNACGEKDEGWIHDFAPFSVVFVVEDRAGNDLLAPDTENSIAENGIYAIYQGEIYQKDSLLIEPESKALYVPFEGLKVEYVDYLGKYALMFGPFLGHDVYVDEPVIFDWGDGTKRDTVTFSNDFWTDGPHAGVERSFRLNGKEVESPIKIIRE